jgi:hypothetical protein
MAKWSLKNEQDRNEVPDMPPELSNYYREEKRDRVWGAWALGFATLVVTIALGVGVFMGGKWLIGRFSGDDEVVTTETSQTENTTSGVGSDASNDDENGQTEGDTSVNDETDSEGVVSDEAAVSSDLPDTGPGDTLAIFLAVAFLATISHSLATRRR